MGSDHASSRQLQILEPFLDAHPPAAITANSPLAGPWVPDGFSSSFSFSYTYGFDGYELWRDTWYADDGDYTNPFGDDDELFVDFRFPTGGQPPPPPCERCHKVLVG